MDATLFHVHAFYFFVTFCSTRCKWVSRRMQWSPHAVAQLLGAFGRLGGFDYHGNPSFFRWWWADVMLEPLFDLLQCEKVFQDFT